MKNSFTSPWFDSECYEAYRDKVRAHKKFKSSLVDDEISEPDKLRNELNFNQKRYMFKNLCNKKMRDNLTIYNSWSYEYISIYLRLSGFPLYSLRRF